MTRIVVVTTSYPAHPGDASGHFVAAEVRALACDGPVRVIAPGETRVVDDVHVVGLGAGALFGWPGALERVRANPLVLRQLPRFVRRARRALEAARPTRIVAHWIIPSAWPIAAHHAERLEVVAHGSDVRLLCTLPRRSARALIAPLLSRGAKLRFVDEDLRHALLEHTGLGALRDADVRPARLDLPRTPNREAARASLALDERPLFVIATRLIAGKRIDVALDALGEVPRVRTVVVGDGPERARLEQRFPSVTWLGQLDRETTLRWIAAADALVSASRLEGAPTTIREARELGVPCIAAPCGAALSWAAEDAGITTWPRPLDDRQQIATAARRLAARRPQPRA